jgi:heptaprenyl diphosphate synthase
VGAILHNLGQIAIAILWTQTNEIIFYFPILLVTGTAAGIVIGLISGMLLKRLEKIKL